MTLQRILVVKLADIGDLLTATPALRALRESFPDARIDLLTTPAAAAAAPSGLVTQVLRAPRNLAATPAELPAALRLLASLRSARYEAAVFLHHLTLRSGAAKYRLLAAAAGAPVRVGLDNGRGGWLTHALPDDGFGACHEVEHWLRVVALLGAATGSSALQAPRLPAAEARAAALLAGLPQPRVALHPGSGGYSLARRWEPARWAALADALTERYGAQIVLVGTPADGADAVAAGTRRCRNLAGQTSLPELAAVLRRCDLFVGADSGVMHLAAASGVPLVALFGPSNHLAWGPWTPQGLSQVVRLGLPCSPCSYLGQQVGQREGCWHRSCMAELEPAAVLDAIARLGVLEPSGVPSHAG